MQTQPDRAGLVDFEIRGRLAAALKCWGRLREDESDELVALFSAATAHFGSGPTKVEREDSKLLRCHAAGLTYNDTKAEGEAKHRLYEIAMRLETGYYTRQEIEANSIAVELDDMRARKDAAEPVGYLVDGVFFYLVKQLHRDGTPVLNQQPVYTARPATQAAQDVLSERQRQISAEGWTPEHDDEHDAGDMAGAAAAYAIAGINDVGRAWAETIWPWDEEWFKPKDVRRNLVKAGALILSEIERMDRAAAKGGAQ